jgi:hypothetical protein
MTMRIITIQGEHYITLSSAAECYEIEVGWVQQVYDEGLLGEGAEVEGDLAIPATMLDRLAEIQRLQNQQGINLSGIAIILDLLGR